MAARVREAQQLRGIQVPRWRSLPALVVPVLETGMEDAVTLAESMDARGHGRGRRTRYRPDRWTLEAALTATAATIAGGVFLTAAWTGHGGLHPATAPLAWPPVEPALLAVIGLLAVPDHPVDQAEDLVAVKLNDLAERLFVAVLEARDEEPLGDAHRVRDPFSPRAGGSQTERRLHVASDNRITRRFPRGSR